MSMRAWIALLLGVGGIVILVWIAVLGAPVQATRLERVDELVAPSAVALGWALLSGFTFRGSAKSIGSAIAVRWAFASWSALALGLCARSGWSGSLVAENLVVAAILAVPAAFLAAATYAALAWLERGR